MSLESLRKLAELNLCKTCYKTYLELLEPSVKNFLFKPLSDWRDVEEWVTLLVMKLEGVFKTDLMYISIDEDSIDEDPKLAGEVDIKAFQQIKRRWSFKSKIRYLNKQGILGDYSYDLLDRAREVRNKIHDTLSEFTPQDLTLISQARVIMGQIYHITLFNLEEVVSKNRKSNVENLAKRWLLKNQE